MVTGVETPDRVEVDEIGTADAAQSISRGPLWWIHRLAPARLTSRIVLLNIAGLIILVAGILYFNQFRQGLIEARPKTGTRVRPRRDWHHLDPDVLAWRSESEPDERFLADILELRRILEPAAARLAAERASAGLIADP